MSMNTMGEEILANWDKAMLAAKIPNMHKNIEQLIKLMTDGIINQEYDGLQFLFKSGAKRIEAWGNQLNIEAKEQYSRVFSYAIFWMSKKISDKLYSNQQKEKAVQRKIEEIKMLQNSKYIIPLLELLEINGEMTQGKIAEQLKLSTQALSNLLRRYEKYKLWDFEKYGRCNYYYLTNDGKNYLCVVQRKKYKDCSDINQVLTYFIDCFAEEMCEPVPDIDSMIHKMNKQFGNTQAIFGSEADKLVLRKSVRKIRASNRRKEWTLYNFSEEESIIDLEENSYQLMEIEKYLEERKEGFI